MTDFRSFGMLLERRLLHLQRQRTRVSRRGGVNAVHDLRVAARRLEEALALLAPVLADAAAKRLRRRVRTIRRSLGRIRNADVRVLDLRALERSLEGTLRRQARAHRRIAQREAALLRGPGPGLRVRAVARRADAVRGSLRPGSDRQVHRRGARLLAKRTLQARRALRDARGGSPDTLHALRIAMKKYRYTLELLDEAGVRGMRRGILLARRLQERLGRLRDLEQLLLYVGRAGPETPDLIHHLESAVAVARAAALKALRAEALSRQLGGRSR